MEKKSTVNAVKRRMGRQHGSFEDKIDITYLICIVLNDAFFVISMTDYRVEINVCSFGDKVLYIGMYSIS